MFFLLRNYCQHLLYLLDKNLNHSAFSVRNLIGLKNVEQSLIQVHENSFWREVVYCFVCLNEDQKIRDCKKKKGCLYCKGSHNSTICSERDKKDDKNKEDSPSRTTNNSATCHVRNQLTSAVLLQTVGIIPENPNTKQKLKSMFFLMQAPILERIRKFLNLCTAAVEDVIISTFGNFQTLSKSIDRVLLVAKTNSHENILIKALCLRLLISSPSITFIKGQFKKFHWIEFVNEDSEKDIDLLIGSDLYWSFVTRNIISSVESGGLVGVETKFGWILSGCVGVGGRMQSVNSVSSATSEEEIGGEIDELESQLKRFLELESLGINECEKSRGNERSRYEVRLPFKENHPLIHDNFELCKRCSLNLHQKPKDKPVFWKPTMTWTPRCFSKFKNNFADICYVYKIICF